MIWRTCCSNAARRRASNIAAIGCSSHSKSYHYPNPSFAKEKVARKLQNNLERILPLALEASCGTFRMRFQPDLLSLPGKLMTSIISPVANSCECVLRDLRVPDSRRWVGKCCRQDSFSEYQYNSKRKCSLYSKQYSHGQVLKPATKHVLATESSY